MSLAAASVVQAPGHDAGSTAFLQQSPLLWIVYLLFSKAWKKKSVCVISVLLIWLLTQNNQIQHSQCAGKQQKCLLGNEL